WHASRVAAFSDLILLLIQVFTRPPLFTRPPFSHVPPLIIQFSHVPPLIIQVFTRPPFSPVPPLIIHFSHVPPLIIQVFTRPPVNNPSFHPSPLSPSQRKGPEDFALDVGRAPAAGRAAGRSRRKAVRPPEQPPAERPPGKGVLCEVGGAVLLALLLGQRAAGEVPEPQVRFRSGSSPVAKAAAASVCQQLSREYFEAQFFFLSLPLSKNLTPATNCYPGK
uniref:Uncharacterized protein n=1 Tax=Oryzias latipes TaxID=8090 RepID=A0A3P9IWR2_ORYLA